MADQNSFEAMMRICDAHKATIAQQAAWLEALRAFVVASDKLPPTSLDHYNVTGNAAYLQSVADYHAARAAIPAEAMGE